MSSKRSTRKRVRTLRGGVGAGVGTRGRIGPAATGLVGVFAIVFDVETVEVFEVETLGVFDETIGTVGVFTGTGDVFTGSGEVFNDAVRLELLELTDELDA